MYYLFCFEVIHWGFLIHHECCACSFPAITETSVLFSTAVALHLLFNRHEKLGKHFIKCAHSTLHRRAKWYPRMKCLQNAADSFQNIISTYLKYLLYFHCIRRVQKKKEKRRCSSNYTVPDPTASLMAASGPHIKEQSHYPSIKKKNRFVWDASLTFIEIFFFKSLFSMHLSLLLWEPNYSIIKLLLLLFYLHLCVFLPSFPRCPLWGWLDKRGQSLNMQQASAVFCIKLISRHNCDKWCM